MRVKKAFLVLAFAMASVIALLYGLSPAWFARTFLGGIELSTDLAHIFRAIMCLYLALACFWLFAAFSDAHRNSAILTTLIFCAGLVTGRLIRFLIDGQPSPLLIFYAAIELLLVPIAAWVYMRPD